LIHRELYFQKPKLLANFPSFRASFDKDGLGRFGQHQARSETHEGWVLAGRVVHVVPPAVGRENRLYPATDRGVASGRLSVRRTPPGCRCWYTFPESCGMKWCSAPRLRKSRGNLSEYGAQSSTVLICVARDLVSCVDIIYSTRLRHPRQVPWLARVQ